MVLQEKLTSMKNPRVVGWKKLAARKGRRESGCFLAEGRKMVEEALKSGFPVETILLREGTMPEHLPVGIPVYELSEAVFDSLSDTVTPQGISAVVRMKERTAEGKILLALDGVQDPGNVGTIIRTADSAGFDGVILSEQCADVFSPKVLRATMGSVFHLPIEVAHDFPGRIARLNEQGYATLSSQLDGGDFYAGVASVTPPLCLIIGSEGNGVTEAVKALATHHVKLPMRGDAESLNAAVAAGIMMYEIMREK